jgi:hypothetical protein
MGRADEVIIGAEYSTAPDGKARMNSLQRRENGQQGPFFGSKSNKEIVELVVRALPKPRPWCRHMSFNI